MEPAKKRAVAEELDRAPNEVGCCNCCWLFLINAHLHRFPRSLKTSAHITLSSNVYMNRSDTNVGKFN